MGKKAAAAIALADEGAAYLAKRIDQLEELLADGPDKFAELDAAWLAKGIVVRAAAWGVPLQPATERAARLLEAFR
jgi:hypothetical protein